MRTREWIVIGIALAGWNAASGQPLQLPSLAPIEPPAESAVPSHILPAPATPSPLPTLLPECANTPVAEVPRPAPIIPETGLYNPYDPSLPKRPRWQRRTDDICGPSIIVWFRPSLELAWMSNDPLPNNIRLRLPVWGGSIPGPVLPTAGRSPGQFGAALGLAGGLWLNEPNTQGLDGSFLYRQMTHTFDVFMPGFLANFPQGPAYSTAQIIPFPDPFAKMIVGWMPGTLRSEFLTLDVNYRFNILGTTSARLDGLIGYRYAHLSDELYLGVPANTFSNNTDPNNPNNQYNSNQNNSNQISYDTGDYLRNRLSVSNNFHGGQVGLAGEARWNDWFISGSAKVAFGTVTSRISTTGTFIGAEGQAGNEFSPLGVLASGTQTDFAIMPAGSVQFGRYVGEHMRVFVGYSFLSLNHVARLSDAVNLNNPDRKLTNFSVHSISLGAELRF